MSIDWGFEDFKDMVVKLWPKSRETDTSLRAKWNGRLRHLPREELKEAMKKMVGIDLDAEKPKWEAIVREVGSKGARPSDSPFQILLNQIRLHARERSIKGAAHWSDEEAFADYLEANRTKFRPAVEVRFWICELKEQNLPVPEFLARLNAELRETENE